MTRQIFRRVALSLPARKTVRTRARRISGQVAGYSPPVLAPIAGGWARMGMTHIRLGLTSAGVPWPRSSASEYTVERSPQWKPYKSCSIRSF